MRYAVTRRCGVPGFASLEAGKIWQLRELLDELGDLLALRGILSSQRFQLVHRRVQITLGDLCRSSSPFSAVEAAGTSRAARR